MIYPIPTTSVKSRAYAQSQAVARRALERCARDLAHLRGYDAEGEYRSRAMPEALAQLLAGFPESVARAAAEGYLKHLRDVPGVDGYDPYDIITCSEPCS